MLATSGHLLVYTMESVVVVLVVVVGRRNLRTKLFVVEQSNARADIIVYYW
jgi:hypothetical protein